MPGFDGTGPLGRGPMTGGGRGYCNPANAGNLPPRCFNRRNPYGSQYHRPFGYGRAVDEFESLRSEIQSLREQIVGLEEKLQQNSNRH